MESTTPQQSISDQWKITDTRFVGFIDIMGFKDMVAKMKHDDIYNMMKKIDEKKQLNVKVNWGKFNFDLITTTTYSDSIMIYSKDDSYESLYSLICTVSSLSEDLFITGIPHKGAVACGTMTLDKENSIFFGQPLIDAFLLQEELYFYGIIVHATAEEKIDLYRKEGKEILFIKPYMCNLKNGTAKHLTIYPMVVDPSIAGVAEYKNDTQLLKESISKFRLRTSGHLRKYIDSTELYFTAVLESGIQIS